MPISQVEVLRAAGVDSPKLAQEGVEIFFTQVFRDGFFHADMHPGNIQVSLAEETFGRRTIEQFEEVGWGSDRAWVAHCIYPNDDEILRLGKWGTGVAHCPSSNMLIGGGGIAPVPEFRAAGVPVGLGCDGSASTDSASLWMEARNALLLGRLRKGPTSMGARDALEIATRGSAGCLGRDASAGQRLSGG